MVGMAETWYRRPKRISVGKRKKRTVHVGYGGNTCKLGEYDGRNGRNVVGMAETWANTMVGYYHVGYCGNTCKLC